MGNNRVAVPTHLFKVVLAEGKGDPALGVFVVPNKPIKDADLTQFQVGLKELESQLGCTFFSKLKSEKVDLCICMEL